MVAQKARDYYVTEAAEWVCSCNQRGMRLTTVGDTFSALQANHDKLSARLRRVALDVTTSGKRIRVHGNYPAFRDGSAQLDDLLKAVHSRIVPFCLPRREIKRAFEEAQAQGPDEAAIVYTELVTKATDLFIKAKKGDKRSGEAGEIMLFLLNEWILKAPQIVSKMYLKTNRNMPVHGTDGIHARFDEEQNTLHLYWGESKAYSTLEGALKAALDSVSDFLASDQQKREIDIVSDHIDLGDASDAEKNAILEYLNPYSELSNKRRTYISCLLVFTFPCRRNPQLDDQALEAEFVNRLKESIAKFIGDIPSKVAARKLENTNFEFFLLPVETAEQFRDKFQALIGWPNA